METASTTAMRLASMAPVPPSSTPMATGWGTARRSTTVPTRMSRTAASRDLRRIRNRATFSGGTIATRTSNRARPLHVGSISMRYRRGRRQDWPAAEAHGQEDDMGTFQHEVAALALGAALLAGGVAGASAQDDEGPNEVESPVRSATLDDGAELLPRAGISLDEAITAAQ